MKHSRTSVIITLPCELGDRDDSAVLRPNIAQCPVSWIIQLTFVFPMWGIFIILVILEGYTDACNVFNVEINFNMFSKNILITTPNKMLLKYFLLN